MAIRLRSHSITEETTNYDSINLRRALIRLERKILLAEPSAPLLRSSFERRKTATNLDHARTLLLRLEHQAQGIKTQSRKHAAQKSLAQERVLIKRLNDRLFELDQLDDYERSSDNESYEDLLGEQHHRSLQKETSLREAPSPSDHDDGSQMAHPATLPAYVASKSIIRSRRPVDEARSTTTALSLEASLYSGHNKSSTAPATTPFQRTPNTASILEAQTATQNDLTASLLTLASALKTSAQSFETDLDTDSSTVAMTESALGRNKDQIEAATRRMGVLRKMSEGRWWWGRMMLYGAIAALWIVAILVVFVMPKLRF